MPVMSIMQVSMQMLPKIGALRPFTMKLHRPQLRRRFSPSA